MLSRRNLLVDLLATGALVGTGSSALANTPKNGFEIDPSLLPQRVDVMEKYVVGQIIVVPSHHLLYWIDQKGSAMRYGSKMAYRAVRPILWAHGLYISMRTGGTPISGFTEQLNRGRLAGPFPTVAFV